LGDSNNSNPPTGGLGYRKSQDFGLNLTEMAVAHSGQSPVGRKGVRKKWAVGSRQKRRKALVMRKKLAVGHP